ncbi:MAG: DUF2892 domain-containing protein [Longimicrobiales bacterium]|nr:DUF2892 domain-containing protein [Longimicrobiales bacterium]
MCSNETHYIVRRIAGIFVLISLALGYFVSPWFLLFTAFVGLNLFQSSFTKWCPMEKVLEKG